MDTSKLRASEDDGSQRSAAQAVDDGARSQRSAAQAVDYGARMWQWKRFTKVGAAGVPSL